MDKHITLLRIPLISCDFYNEDDNVLIYFTISETSFKRIIGELKEELGEKDKYIIEDLIKWSYEEIQANAELDSMSYVYEKAENDILNEEIVYPKEFDVLYQRYVETSPYYIDKQNRKWKVQSGNSLLSKFELTRVMRSGNYKLIG